MRSLYVQVCMDMHGVMDTLQRSTWHACQGFILGLAVYLLAAYCAWPEPLAQAVEYVLPCVGGFGFGILYAWYTLRKVLAKDARPVADVVMSRSDDYAANEKEERV